MGLLDDGGSGKGKIALDARQRGALLAAVFALGCCIGLVAAERIYIATNRSDILAGVSAIGGGARAAAAAEPAASATAAAASAPAAAAAARAEGLEPAAVAAAVASDPELRSLRDYLAQIAPQGEVLIGVSNQNPMLEGMLDTWLEGVKQAGVSCDLATRDLA